MGERYGQRPSSLIGVASPVAALCFDIACYREHELDLPNMNKDGSIWTWRERVNNVRMLRSKGFEEAFRDAVAEMRDKIARQG